MQKPFSLAQHPRRPAPLSSPPPGYFEGLPAQVMARVQPAPARPVALAWLLRAPAALRTGLASTLLLGTFAASLWLGGTQASLLTAPTASLDQVPREQLLEYLTSGETHVDLLDLSELPAHHAALAPQYLHPSAGELREALLDAPAGSENDLP